MKISSVSTYAQHDSLRALIQRTQSALDRAANEVASGRRDDITVALGAGVARVAANRLDLLDLDATLATNAIVSDRLAVTQAALNSMTELADGFFKSVLSAANGGTDRSVLVEDARSRLATLTGLINATSNGAYVLAGTNSGQSPFADYLAQPQPASRGAVHAAFLAEFGFASGDPQAATLTAGQVQAYLSGTFATLFASPTWETTFSSASNLGAAHRIGANEVVTTTITANAPAIRHLAAALIAVIDSGTENFGAETFASFATEIARGASSAASELTEARAGIGLVQARLTQADERMTVQRSIIEATIGGLENIDAAEASTRLQRLATQLDVSYAVTARLQRLSLLNHI